MFVMKARREGFALAAAVLAMLIVGAIVTGGFYAANTQSSVVRSEYRAGVAQYIAETGLDATVANTSAATLDAMAMNTTTTVYNAIDVSYGGKIVGRYTTTVTRTTNSLYIVQSTGTVTTGGAGMTNVSRTVGNIMRLRVVDFDDQTALKIFGDLDVGGTADILGTDTFMPSWTSSNCSITALTSAVTAQPSATVGTHGSGSITGTTTRQTMDSTNFTVFGDMTYAEVVSMATKTYAAGTTLSGVDAVCNPSGCGVGSTCTTTNGQNWGAPVTATNPCFTYFPIIHALGDIHITSNGKGQGILLVDGNLSITGQFEFYGPIIVRGTIDVGAGGSNVYGSVFAYGGGTIGADNSVNGGMVLEYSSCAIKRAVLGATGLSRGVAIRNRSWFDVTTVQNSY